MRSLIDNISANLVFFPPQPPTYQLSQHGDGARELYIEPTAASGARRVSRARVHRVPSPAPKAGGGGGGGRQREPAATLVAAFCPGGGAPPGSAAGVRWTLLHSHGNAVDLGEMLPLYEEIARALRCNVVGYDYAGYGCSSGKPSVSQARADLAAVMSGMLRDQLGKQPADVVLYGQSVGSGPTCHLAAQLPDLGGVVLHSPFMSGMRVLNPGWRLWPAWLDVFPSYKLVPRIACPTLIMHGTQDDVIDVSHGRQLHQLCKRPSEPLWAEGRGHQDVEACPEYVPRLRRFLVECWGDEYRQHLRAGGVSLT